MCTEMGVEIHVAADNTKSKSAQEEMVDDMMALIASFSGEVVWNEEQSEKRWLSTHRINTRTVSVK